MDLRAELLKEHSRIQTEKIAGWVQQRPERIEQLMQLFLHDEYRVVQRAAWVLSLVAERNNDLAEPWLPLMVQRLSDTGIPIAVKRNVVRILQFVPIPADLHGDVMNICFELLADPKETIAVRVFAMTVLANLAKVYPDIANEIRSIIEDQLEQGASAGFRARAKMILKNI